MDKTQALANHLAARKAALLRQAADYARTLNGLAARIEAAVATSDLAKVTQLMDPYNPKLAASSEEVRAALHLLASMES